MTNRDKKQKKILQIAKGEYLLDAGKEGVVTTYNKDVAMDISGWKFDSLAYFISNLHKVGYIKAQVLTIDEKEEKEEDNGEEKEDKKEEGDADGVSEEESDKTR